MKHLLLWAQSFALVAGGPGLFVVAFLDSSFLSLPEINDILVVWLVMQHTERLLYYALMSTLGSIAGCFLVYFIGRKGGEALLRRNKTAGAGSRSMALFQRYGMLAVLVPALLPPPAPFKIFVLMAGVARVRVGIFAVAVGVGRGLRYLVVGLLAIWYGQAAVTYVKTNAKPVALAAAGVVLLGGLIYYMISARRQETRTDCLDCGEPQ